MTDIELIEQSFQIAWVSLRELVNSGSRIGLRIFFLMRLSACCGVANGAGSLFQNRAIDAYRNQPVKLAS
jgi:hypothetical protein